MADDSIAVVDLERCQPDRCNYECVNFCPPNRTGKECIVTREERHGDEPYDGKPDQVSISEEICLGETCGICVEKCPFDAIQIINLPTELDEAPVHRYGENAFSLYGLPIPSEGRVTGVLGPNGIGKTTAVHILAGELVPNRGRYNEAVDWAGVMEAYRGSELQQFLGRVVDDEITISRKPQYVDRIPDQFDGLTADLLASTDERGVLDELIERFEIGAIVDSPVEAISGGELQRVAIAACLARDADVYFLDEVTPYLDIGQRLTVARTIREIADEADRAMLVVEHDLAVLDLLADVTHLAYGEPGAFGVVTDPRSVKAGINEYLEGYLENENVRIRERAIEFESSAPRSAIERDPLFAYPAFDHQFGADGFRLVSDGGDVYANEVLGVLGPNGIGKTTFARLLTGEVNAEDDVDLDLTVSYKPQYVEVDQPMTVETFLRTVTDDFGSSMWETELARPLQLPRLYELQLPDLSGGERQRVAIAACLSESADVYLLDEPSAHLDVEQRVGATTAIRRFADRVDTTVMVIDHDIYMIDLLADRLLVFDGEPARHGHVGSPQPMREGMNAFLEDVGITFRRDQRTGRPRINKPGSQLDRQQRDAGEYYYPPAE